MVLPERLAAGQAVKAAAQMQQVSPEMVKKIAAGAAQRLIRLGQQSRRAYGGVKSRCGPFEPNGSTLKWNHPDTMNKTTRYCDVNPKLDVHCGDFLGNSEPGMRELLGQVDKKTLSIALKSASEDLRIIFSRHVFAGGGNVEEDMKRSGPMRARDVAAAQNKRLWTVARRLETEGKMVLKAGGRGVVCRPERATGGSLTSKSEPFRICRQAKTAQRLE